MEGNKNNAKFSQEKILGLNLATKREMSVVSPIKRTMALVASSQKIIYGMYIMEYADG